MKSQTTTQGRGKRETLLSRSKRIIGKQLPSDTTSGDDDDDEGESKTPQSDVSKRRTQILKAQRTHRRRTQNYIQELEKEVLRLRAREAEMQNELESRSSSFRLRSPSIGLPSPSTSTGSDQSQHYSKNDYITVDLTSYAQLMPERSCAIGAALVPTPEYSPPTADVPARLADIGITDAGTCTGAVCGMDTQAAIEFILDLERPCLSHVKFDMHNQIVNPFKAPVFNSGHSHACTASASIIQSHQHVDLINAPIRIPVSEIERLLEISKSLPLGPEMTPVQVWALLVNITSRHAITASVYASLKNELRKYVRCNGFGATIQIDVLRRVVNWFFPWYPTDQLRDRKIHTTEWTQEQMDNYAGVGWEEFF